MLDCKGGGQEKWSSGLQEALPTNHNGGWGAKWLCAVGSHSPEVMVWSDPDFSDPGFSDPNFSNPSQSGSQF
jgi:hypothetical protein